MKKRIRIDEIQEAEEKGMTERVNEGREGKEGRRRDGIDETLKN